MARNKGTGDAFRGAHEAEDKALINAIHRCHNPDHAAYYNYGARGIWVQDELRGPDGLKLLIGAIGPRPTSKHTLDRIDNDGGYTIDPLNIRWATRKTQQNNRRGDYRPRQDFGWGFGVKQHAQGSGSASLSPLLPHNGRIQTLAEWAEQLGLNSATIRQRLRRGLTPAQALNPSTSRKGEKPTRKSYKLSAEQISLPGHAETQARLDAMVGKLNRIEANTQHIRSENEGLKDALTRAVAALDKAINAHKGPDDVQ